jgi:tetratricopeptide (TPR) repeat protein
MIDVLEQLLTDGKYREALKLAEQILSDGVESPADLLAVQNALLVAHYRLQEWTETLVPGDMALSLAQETGNWDAFGTAAIFVSAAYARLGQYETAISRTYEYLAHVGMYRAAARHEGRAWYNLGTHLLKLGRPTEAATAFSKSLAAEERQGDHRNAHGARHALIEASLKAQDLKPIPLLLARSSTYLRHHPEALMIRDSWAYHKKLRAEFALATGRPGRAIAVALSGLSQNGDALHHACRFHIILAHAARQRGIPWEAVGHAMAAQACARESGRPDVEAEAGAVLLEMSLAYPDALQTVDQYYLTQ